MQDTPDQRKNQSVFPLTFTTLIIIKLKASRLCAASSHIWPKTGRSPFSGYEWDYNISGRHKIINQTTIPKLYSGWWHLCHQPKYHYLTWKIIPCLLMLWFKWRLIQSRNWDLLMILTRNTNVAESPAGNCTDVDDNICVWRSVPVGNKSSHKASIKLDKWT